HITDDAIAVFSRDVDTGKLTFVEVQKNEVNGVDGLYGALEITVSPDNRHVYTASPESDAVAVFERDFSSGALSFVEVQRGGTDGINGLTGVRSVTVSPDNKYVYTASTADDAVTVFSRNLDTGGLTFVEMQKEEGVGAGEITVTHGNDYIYVLNHMSGYSRGGGITAFKRNM
ncbi:MAG: lactonase family protein, partial [Planctomycetes bacterium]|nr:lactonase family protein [Planctomycetota bacterium]